MKLINLGLLLLLVIASACSGSRTSTPEANLPTSISAVYPMPEEINGDSLHPTFGELAPTWTPDATLSQVTGKLLLNGKPVVDLNLYLGKTIQDAQGLEFAASLDRLRDPTSLTDINGGFHFMNVPPGNYVLILDNVTSVSLLMDPKGEQAILVKLSGGETKDLGVLDYDELPIAEP